MVAGAIIAVETIHPIAGVLCPPKAHLTKDSSRPGRASFVLSDGFF